MAILRNPYVGDDPDDDFTDADIPCPACGETACREPERCAEEIQQQQQRQPHHHEVRHGIRQSNQTSK